jgi:hypothetical protein
MGSPEEARVNRVKKKVEEGESNIHAFISSRFGILKNAKVVPVLR